MKTVFSVRFLLCVVVVAGSVCQAAEAPEPELPTEQVSKRLFGVIPDYKADAFQRDYKPISTHEKFAIAHSDSFDWPNYLLLIGTAAQSQMAGGGSKHNGGMTGFSKFYARSVGNQIIGAYLTEAILPSLLHEDPRFFRLGARSAWIRAFRAAEWIVVTKKDSGRNGFNFSEVAGNALVVGITTVYYPDSRSAGAGLERFGIALGNDVVSNMLTEFWPDIRRRLAFHRRA